MTIYLNSLAMFATDVTVGLLCNMAGHRRSIIRPRRAYEFAAVRLEGRRAA